MQISRATQAILLMIASMAGFAAMSATVRHVSQSMPTTEMVLLRNVLSLFMVGAWGLFLYKGNGFLRTDRLTGHFWRASIGFCSMELWFYALSILPLNLATALSFTTPIFATLLAIILLGERAGWRRWSAIVASFAGVLIILRPGAGSMEMSSLIVLASAFLMAIASIFVKHLTRTEPPETIVFYMALFMTVYSVPFAAPSWQPVTGEQWIGLAAIAFFSSGAHLLLARAYMRADMVTLTPFDFTRLIFTAALAYVFFNEGIDMYTLLGAAVIVASSFYIARREVGKNVKDEMETLI